MSEPGGRVPGFDSIELEREHLELVVSAAAGSRCGFCGVVETLFRHTGQPDKWICLDCLRSRSVPLPDAESHPSIQRPQTDLGE